jgi:TrfA protein
MPTLRAGHPAPVDGPDHASPLTSDPEWRAQVERIGRFIDARNTAAPSAPVPTATPAPRLPVFPAAARPVVNDVARSALFTCVQGKDRQMYKQRLLATVEGVEIRFTGEQWNQDDHDLLMQVVHMAAKVPLGAYALLAGHAILQGLGRQTSGREYAQLRDDLERLVAGTVSLRNTTRKVEYIGHLIEKAVQHETSRHWLIMLNPDLRALYGPSTYTLVDWAQRLRLRGKDLARWLHAYLATHAVPFPVKVATLRDLSGSRTTALWKFRQRLRHALADLQDFGVLSAWEIDDTDLVHVARGEAVTSSQRRHLDRHARRR